MYEFPTSNTDQVWLKRVQTNLAKRGLAEGTFSKLYDLLRCKRLTRVALTNVLRNKGARTPGVDGISKRDLESLKSRKRLAVEITSGLRGKTYSPLPVRRIYIPKANGKVRPLGIPTIKDRTVQEMLRLILEPIYEGMFYSHSYGFRPYRATHHAASRLWSLNGRWGYEWVIEGDIKACFDEIDHQILTHILRNVIKDEKVIRLIKIILSAGYDEDGTIYKPSKGTPQGGIVSPLLANVFLNELDQYVAGMYDHLEEYQRQKAPRRTFIVRYADDFVVVAKSREDAVWLKDKITTFLTDLGLTLSKKKTSITHIDQGYDFLGFNIRRYDSRVLIRPSKPALKKFRRNFKARLAVAIHKYGFSPEMISCLNTFIWSWAQYYRWVSSKRSFRKLDHYIWHTTYRKALRFGGPHATKRGTYLKRFLPRSLSTRKTDRKYAGRQFGVWKEEGKRALLLISLKQIPIEYVPFFKERHPYLPENKEKLEKHTRLLPMKETAIPAPVPIRSVYGNGWKMVRNKVLKRDKYRCVVCGTRGNLDVHHIDLRAALPNAEDESNLVSLCRKCHVNVHKSRWCKPSEVTDN